MQEHTFKINADKGTPLRGVVNVLLFCETGPGNLKLN